MEFYEMEIHEISHGIPWNFMEIHQPQFHDIPCNSMKFHEKFHGIP
jgi:hypothetical protein